MYSGPARTVVPYFTSVLGNILSVELLCKTVDLDVCTNLKSLVGLSPLY